MLPGDKMGSIKIKAKYLLLGNNTRLFFLCGIAPVLRWGSIALWSVAFYTIAASELFEKLTNRYSYALIYTDFVAAALFSLFIIFLFSAALRMSEQIIIYNKCNSQNSEKTLFSEFFTLKNSFKYLRFYVTSNFLKICWLIYYLSPAVICLSLITFLYGYAKLPAQALFILLAGVGVFLSLSLFTWHITCLRYCCAPLFFQNNHLSPLEAINKSIYYTDGVLNKTALLEASFMGWFLSCLLIIPVFYVLPYYRLSKALLIYNHSTSRSPVSDSLSGEHI